jgi:plastocyanin
VVGRHRTRGTTRGIGPRTVVVAGVLLVALAACGDGDGTSDDAGATEEAGGGAELVIVDFGFEPDTLEVADGTTIEVVNEDAVSHTVTAEDGSFDVRLAGGGNRMSITPDGPGTYPFVCTIHPSMTGTLVVS